MGCCADTKTIGSSCGLLLVDFERDSCVVGALTVEMKLVRMYGRLPDGFRVILIALVALRKRSTGSS